ncbi:MAG TPA: cytochrome c [Baekduia sp.]|uniref:c-type cytochrome n=1 Tax=Baekduia sp. TaxID=2600305 RepID=UPI002D78AFB5|nr:cytochrome c [Baekduia sp.]HET6510295.1 cytochrome c [Baekduia sp.]
MRRAPLVAAAGAVALAVAGCGGGGSSTRTSTATTTSSAVATGKQLFTSVGCSSCHTLADAGAKGQVGPNLDTLRPSDAAVVRQVTHGGGGMPAFDDQLSAQQIQAVARYVSSVAGH